jgi:hypothetical protein
MEAENQKIRIDIAVRRSVKNNHKDFALLQESAGLNEHLKLATYIRRHQESLLENYCKAFFDQCDIRFALWMHIPDLSKDFDFPFNKTALCPDEESFYKMILMNNSQEYRYEGHFAEIFIYAKDIPLININNQSSEEEKRDRLKQDLETDFLNHMLAYRCWLDTHKKMKDFEACTNLNQWTVVEKIDPHKEYKRYGLKFDKESDINEPFFVIRGFMSDHKPPVGSPRRDKNNKLSS